MVCTNCVFETFAMAYANIHERDPPHGSFFFPNTATHTFFMRRTTMNALRNIGKRQCQVMLIIVALLALTTSDLYAQLQRFTLQNREYRFEGNKSFTFLEGKKGDEIIPQRLIVRLKDRGHVESFDFQQLNINGVSMGSRRFLDGYYVLTISPDRDAFDIASTLERTQLFDVLEFDAIGERHGTPNDPNFGQQWNLPKIRMPQGWDITTGNSSIILGIIDSGTRYTHEDLDANIWVNPAEDRNGNGRPDFTPYSTGGDLDGTDNDGNGFVDDLIGWDFAGGGNNPQPPFTPDNNPEDTDGHGTNVSGVMSAQTNNSEGGSYRGIAGVAGGWGTSRGASLMVLRDGGQIPFESLTAQAIEYAARNGARAINISTGYTADYTVVRDAVNLAVNTYGVVIVASAGNNGNTGDPTPRYPARYANTICVGATDQTDIRRSYSAYGPQMDVVAPDGVPSTTMAGGYTNSVTGTSFSAPHVAGLAALLRSVNPSLTWQQVRDILRSSADDRGPSGFDNEYGYGRINALRALGTAYVTNHPDYEFVYSSGALSYYDNFNMVFLAGPNWCNAAGTYYNTERHRLLIQVNRSFTETPLAWYLGPVGYSWANPNNASTWLSQTVNANTIRYETVFYRLNQGNFSCENRWAPFDPNSTEKAYAYLGRPLVAPVISGFTQTPVPIYRGSSGTVTCNLSQGTGSITYSWTARDVPSGVSITYNGNTANICYLCDGPTGVQRSKKPKGGVPNDPNAIFRLTCTASNGAGTSTSTFYPSLAYSPPPPPPGGCPFVYSYNGTEFITDNNILPQSQLPENEGQDVTDYYQLFRTPTEEEGTYLLAIGEFENEHSFLDQTKLLVIDHDPGAFITVDDSGTVIQFAKPAAFADAQLESTDVLKYLEKLDDVKVEVAENDTMKLWFTREGGEYEEGLLLIGQVPIKEAVAGRVVSKDRQQSATFTNFRLRRNPSYTWVLVGTADTSTVQIDIEWKQDAAVDYSELSKKLELPFTLQEATLLSATHSSAGDVTENLRTWDENYAELMPQEWMRLEFQAPPTTQGWQRSFVFVSRGRYMSLEGAKPTLPKQSQPNTTTANVIRANRAVPTEFSVSQNYPNPFNPTTVIKYQLPRDSYVTLKLYDILGREIKTLVDGMIEAGFHEVSLDASQLSSGVYLYSLKADDFNSVKRLLLLK
jgi:subtilisin family serine protease